jgi:hypothetical protein
MVRRRRRRHQATCASVAPEAAGLRAGLSLDLAVWLMRH